MRTFFLILGTAAVAGAVGFAAGQYAAANGYNVIDKAGAK